MVEESFGSGIDFGSSTTTTQASPSRTVRDLDAGLLRRYRIVMAIGFVIFLAGFILFIIYGIVNPQPSLYSSKPHHDVVMYAIRPVLMFVGVVLIVRGGAKYRSIHLRNQ